mgnify:CR=1 FL=1
MNTRSEWGQGLAFAPALCLVLMIPFALIDCVGIAITKAKIAEARRVCLDDNSETVCTKEHREQMKVTRYPGFTGDTQLQRQGHQARYK